MPNAIQIAILALAIVTQPGPLLSQQGAGVDKYREFYDADRFSRVQENLSQHYQGIGVRMIQNASGRLEIIEVFSDSPAQKAGVRAGDIVESINGVSALTMSLSEAVQSIRGRPGSPISLSIRRPDEPTKHDLEIMRNQVAIASIDPPLIVDESILYLRIREFGNLTDNEFRQSVESTFTLGKPQHLLLDLRGNTGGILDSALKIIDDLVAAPSVMLVVREFRPMRRREHVARDPVRYPFKSITILVNRNTASAAEVLAGSLRLNAAAKLVGGKTYGKGTIQSIYALRNGTGAKITTAAFYLPDGQPIEGRGLIPDLESRAPTPQLLVTAEAIEADPTITLARLLIANTEH